LLRPPNALVELQANQYNAVAKPPPLKIAWRLQRWLGSGRMKLASSYRLMIGATDRSTLESPKTTTDIALGVKYRRATRCKLVPWRPANARCNAGQ